MQYLLSACQVLIGPAGRRFDNGAVLVQGESIVAVGGHDEVRAAGGADLVELAFPAATIMPGLINAHVHLAFNVGPDRLEELLAPIDEPRLALAMAGRAQQLLNCGVTTVRDLGDRGGLTVALRESIEAGDLAGPRILAATAPLTPPGGHCWFLGGEVAGCDQIRQQIRRNAAAGADVIKVMVSGGSMTPGGAEMWQPQFSTGELRIAVEEAHRLGLPLAAHAHGTSSIRVCVEAGVDTIEHCTWLTGPGVFEPDEQIVAGIVAAGIAVCTATSNNWRLFAKKYGAERAQQIIGRVRWMADRGVRLITGTDAGMGPFGNFPAALRALEEWGFTREQILEMATVTTADALGLASTAGALHAGYSADLLVVDGDPLTDLTALQRLTMVMARGRPHRVDSSAVF
ncbi:MAG: amidohydrolase family protein [Pseudonocardiaceae bacterium]